VRLGLIRKTLQIRKLPDFWCSPLQTRFSRQEQGPTARVSGLKSPFAKLGLQLNTNHLKGEEAKLVADVLANDGIVLIAWEHQAIPFIANSIIGSNTSCPQSWPDSRFDLVWVFDQDVGSGEWIFHQVPQRLLAGDSCEPI
jgi:hypothetical protein